VYAQNSLPPAVFIEGLAARLAPLLEPHGLAVTHLRDDTIQVRNPAGYAAADARGRALSPGLEQRVTALEYDGGVWWVWVWADRGAPPEVEPMVPVEEVEEAVRRIVNVLRAEEPARAER
jgi:hypothetical protein